MALKTIWFWIKAFYCRCFLLKSCILFSLFFSLEIWTKYLMLMKIRSPFTFIQAEGHPLRQCTLVISSHFCSQSKLFLLVVLIKEFFSKETLNMACENVKMIHCKEFWLCEVNSNEFNSVLPFHGNDHNPCITIKPSSLLP